jgi:hypothetical protein
MNVSHPCALNADDLQHMARGARVQAIHVLAVCTCKSTFGMENEHLMLVLPNVP